MRDPTKLFIWQRAVELSAKVAKAFPISVGRKSPGLRRQAIRAASGISEAIAEGCGKFSELEFARYLDTACGSVTELQTQLLLAQRHGILNVAQLRFFWRECAALRKMIVVFARKVRERAAQKERDDRSAKEVSRTLGRIVKPECHPPRRLSASSPVT